MRVLLGGRAIPREEFALAGSGVDTSSSVPITLLMEDGEVFNPEDYISLGYTNFEVWCIGASGGQGGSRGGSATGSGTHIAGQGGAGGGGGLHRVSGLLLDLPDEVPVVVGQAGANGANDNGENPRIVTNIGRQTYVGPYPQTEDSVRNPANWQFESPVVVGNPAWVPAQPGGDGGYSAFGEICKASGGKGGLTLTMEFETGSFDWILPGQPGYSTSVVSNPFYSPYGPRVEAAFSRVKALPGKGGEGGSGNRTTAGGGGAGGYGELGPETTYSWSLGNPSVPFNQISIKPKDGPWDGTVGKGGGGGLGTLTYSSYERDLMESV